MMKLEDIDKLQPKVPDGLHGSREGNFYRDGYADALDDLRALLAAVPVPQEGDAVDAAALLERERRDAQSLASLLAKERARFRFLHTSNRDADGWEWGVARIRISDNGQVEYLWGATDHSDIDAARAALLAAQPAEQKPYGWLTGNSTSHRTGEIWDFTRNIEVAQAACDEYNRDAQQDKDPEHVDRVPVPLFLQPQPAGGQGVDAEKLKLMRSHASIVVSHICQHAANKHTMTGWLDDACTSAEILKQWIESLHATPSAPVEAGRAVEEAEPAANTGNAEADRIINRLMSSDPDFQDCTDAAALIQRLAAPASQAVSGQAVAWAYECRQPHTDPVIWCEFLSREKPGDDPYWIRNVSPLYAAPVQQEGDGRAVEGAAAIAKAFVTLESTDGRYQIVMKFNQRANAHAAHDYLLSLGGKEYNVAPPAGNQQEGDALDVLPVGFEAMHVPPDQAMTEEYNRENCSLVKRVVAPYCGDDGIRMWTGPTLAAALGKARAALAQRSSEENDHATR
jgi:hypothetical protein